MKIITNPDTALAEVLKIKVKNNGGYCPCNIVKNEDTKCMCKSFRESTELGECHCGLYVRVAE